jgi:hypothetical protein
VLGPLVLQQVVLETLRCITPCWRCSAGGACAGGAVLGIRCASIWEVSGHPGALKSSGSDLAVVSRTGCRHRDVRVAQRSCIMICGSHNAHASGGVGRATVIRDDIVRAFNTQENPEKPIWKASRGLVLRFASSHCGCTACFVRRNCVATLSDCVCMVADTFQSLVPSQAPVVTMSCGHWLSHLPGDVLERRVRASRREL